MTSMSLAEYQQQTKKPKKSKYKNVKCEYNGIWFDSQKERNRYIHLKLLERAGKIKDLRLQVPFDLLPTTRIGGVTQNKTVYWADFVYFDIRKNCEVVEDAKGVKTDIYQLKRKLMWVNLGIEIKEV